MALVLRRRSGMVVVTSPYTPPTHQFLYQKTQSTQCYFCDGPLGNHHRGDHLFDGIECKALSEYWVCWTPRMTWSLMGTLSGRDAGRSWLVRSLFCLTIARKFESRSVWGYHWVQYATMYLRLLIKKWVWIHVHFLICSFPVFNVQLYFLGRQVGFQPATNAL